MSRNILYFINPISGAKPKNILQQLLTEKTAKQKFFFEILFTNDNGNYPFLADKIKNGRFTDVVICGGDGTVNQITSSLLGIDINIGIIPVGLSLIHI